MSLSFSFHDVPIINNHYFWAVVVAQLVKQSLPTQEVGGKNILKNYCQLYWKDKNKEKEAENGPFFKKSIIISSLANVPSLLLFVLCVSLGSQIFLFLFIILLWLSHTGYFINLSVSVTRLGNFWKFLVTKFLTKVTLMLKTAVATLWAFFNSRDIVYSNIWSHCYLSSNIIAFPHFYLFFLIPLCLSHTIGMFYLYF